MNVHRVARQFVVLSATAATLAFTGCGEPAPATGSAGIADSAASAASAASVPTADGTAPRTP